jgi:hypothetical protein
MDMESQSRRARNLADPCAQSPPISRTCQAPVRGDGGFEIGELSKVSKPGVIVHGAMTPASSACQAALFLSARAAQALAVRAMEPFSLRGNVVAKRVARSFCFWPASEDK